MSEIVTGEFISQTDDERNYHVLRSWFPRWVWNTACNFQRIKSEFEHGAEYALADYEKKYVGEPAIIAGAGPSFDKVAPILKDWKGALFTSESMAKVCMGWDRKPDYVCLFDGNRIPYMLDEVNWKGSTLITHPAVCPETVANWKWDKLYYVMMHISQVEYSKIDAQTMTLDGLVEFVKDQTFGSDFFEHINPILFPFIKTQILNSGCVVNNAIQVAHFMGYNPLFLVGCDFGFPNNIMRSRKWVMPKRLPFEPEWLWRKRWTLQDAQPLSDIGRTIQKGWNGVLTTEEQLEYKYANLSIYKIDRPDIFDCSDGLLTEYPKLDGKEVIEKNGRGYEKLYRGDEEKVRVADNFFYDLLAI